MSSRIKINREHAISLSEQAVNILELMKPISDHIVNH